MLALNPRVADFLSIAIYTSNCRAVFQTLSKRNAESLAPPPLTLNMSESNSLWIKSLRSPRLQADGPLSQSFSSGSSSPLSSGQNSPAASFNSSRPGSLQGLSKTLQCLKSPSRRKSVHNIPLSPLARTPSPSPMAVSPTSLAPPTPSKLAVVGVKSSPNPATTQTFKHLGNKSKLATSEHSSLTGSATVAPPTTATRTHARRHNSITASTDSSQSRAGSRQPAGPNLSNPL